MLSAAAKTLAEEAKRRGVWLYDPSYRKWYSPEDFQHCFHYAKASTEFLQQLQLRHPAEGIEPGFKQLLALQTKLDAFTRAVMTYYVKRGK